jgi:hypothetical protein
VNDVWQALPISGNMYGFLLESNWHEAWTATAIVIEKERKLEIHTDIHIYYVRSKEEYEQLLDAIRYFSDVKKREMKKEGCVIRFRCMGVSSIAMDGYVPAQSHASGHMLIDTEFSEELVPS